jgi:class 3 adenylate cyclase
MTDSRPPLPFARVLEIIRQGREPLGDRLTSAVIQTVPQYETVDRTGLHASVVRFLDTLVETLVTGNDESFIAHLHGVTRDRATQGVTVGDFVRALNVCYPCFRDLVREMGPEQDRTLGQEFHALEARLHHLSVIATDVYVSVLQRQLEGKNAALNRAVQLLQAREKALASEVDITSRALRSAQEFSRRVVDSLVSGIAVINPDRSFSLFTSRMEQIVEIPVEEALTRTVDELATRLEGLDVENALTVVRRTGRLPLTKRRLTLPSGRSRTVYVQAQRLYGDDGGVEGTVVVVDDITERELLLDSFSRYVSRDLVQRLLARGQCLGLGGERRTCTILFADIRGFTGLAERLTPEHLHETLNTYFRIMVAEVTEHGGFIDKFVGDKVMALFTAGPDDHRPAAVSAVRAGESILRHMDGVGPQRAAAGLPPIEVGVGINTGEVILGNVGSENRMDFTAIGDPVNVADRLQALALGGAVVVGEETVGLCGDACRFEGEQELTVKGRQGRVKAWRLVRA